MFAIVNEKAFEAGLGHPVKSIGINIEYMQKPSPVLGQLLE